MLRTPDSNIPFTQQWKPVTTKSKPFAVYCFRILTHMHRDTQGFMHLFDDALPK